MEVIGPNKIEVQLIKCGIEGLYKSKQKNCKNNLTIKTMKN